MDPVEAGHRSDPQLGGGLQLNVGCGGDPFGDVRVDMSRRGTANVIASAEYLPFANKSFLLVRCWHVLEHCKRPQRALDEAMRVALEVNARFPYRYDRVPWVLSWLSTFSPGGVRGGFREIWLDLSTKTVHPNDPMRHRWMVRPFGRTKLNGVPFPSFFTRGRKANHSRRMVFYIPAEWECWV